MTELQKELLTFYKELVALLDKNNIKHFAIGGTAIGAFREKGFIEWDDDMDIAIFEEDAELFQKIIKESRFAFNDRKIEPWRNFFKISNPDVKIQHHVEEVNLHIDVFLAYKKRKVTKWTFIRRDIISYLKWIKVNSRKYLIEQEKKRGNKVAGLWFCGTAIPKYLFPIFWKRKKWRDNSMKIFKNKKIIDDGFRYFYHSDPQNRILTLDASKIIMKDFEGAKMPVTHNFINESKPVYGDVMKPYKNPKTNGNHGFKIKKTN